MEENSPGSANPIAGPVQVYNIGSFETQSGPSTTPRLANGDNSDTNGISIRASGDTSNLSTVGGWIFVQIINQVSFSYVTSPPSSKFVLQPGLDTTYPFQGGADLNDSPSISLDVSSSMFTAVGEKSESIQFSDYLMWDPQIPPPGSDDCQLANSRVGAGNIISYNPSTCASIPVPIATLSWGFEGDAIKTLNPGQGAGANTWILNCGSAQTPTLGTGTIGFPNWTSTANASQIPQ